LPQPAAVGALGKHGQQCFEDNFQIADERDIHADILVDLRGIDLNVDLFGMRRVVSKIAGDAIVEAHAEGEQQVGFLDGVVHPRFAVHAHHAEVQRMGGGEAAEAEQRGGYGNLLRFGKGDHLLLRAGVGDAVAGENDGAFCGLDQRNCFADGAGFGAQHGMRPRCARRAVREVEGRGGLLRVLGDVDEHRAGTAGGRDLKSEADRRRDVFRASDEEVVLGDGQSDAGDVDFLKGVGAQHF
jgi:hypothetical protein